MNLAQPLSSLDRKALEFVAQKGGPFEVWRARRLLGAREPLGVAAVTAGQNLDGGWRKRGEEGGGPQSNTGMTTMSLLDLVFCRLGNNPAARKTVDYLWRTQKADGRWTEDPAQTDLPPWNLAGNVNVDIWETANICVSLLALGLGPNPRVSRAIEWVQSRGEKDGVFPGYNHATFAMAAARNLRGENVAARRHLDASVRILKESRDEDWFDTMELTWPLRLWYLGRFAATDRAVIAYLKTLKEWRLEDGTWPTRYKGFETQYTLHAVEVTQAFAGRLPY